MSMIRLLGLLHSKSLQGNSDNKGFSMGFVLDDPKHYHHQAQCNFVCSVHSAESDRFSSEYRVTASTLIIPLK